ncbi:DUF3011 domain-containing protein [Aerosakkonemataceae cyanobacterium BLCC-F154]|uniref:DUF3011 domain-containing protein n=1 Tax=Floridaenema fluviatile BLCC-F154 TaxID=3153640 RepID=A0ABV4YJ76_9CYAN
MTNLCQKVALAGAAVVAVAATIIIAESASAQTVTICQSVNFQTTKCSINTRRGVFLDRQLSRASCIRGVDWDYGRGFVWVRNGCRAEFRSSGGWDEGDRDRDWDRNRDRDREEYCIEEETFYTGNRKRPVRRSRRVPCP